MSYNLLFVCTGNTCRSPMAEALARHAIRERGWSQVEVGSAGTGALDGSPASDAVPVVLAERDVELGPHAARALTPELVEWADLILAMSPSHLGAVDAMGGGERAQLVTDFLEGDEAGRPVLDPIGGGAEVYRDTRDQLERAVDALLDRLEPIVAP